MKKKMIILAILVTALVLVTACTNNTQDKTDIQTNDEQNMMTDTPKDTTAKDVKTFELTGVNFDFMMNGEENPTITVKQGDRVRIEFESTDGFHDWVIDEFDAATERVNPGDDATTVTFTANKKGTFEYYCSVGSHRAQGMWGNLIVQ